METDFFEMDKNTGWMKVTRNRAIPPLLSHACIEIHRIFLCGSAVFVMNMNLLGTSPSWCHTDGYVITTSSFLFNVAACSSSVLMNRSRFLVFDTLNNSLLQKEEQGRFLAVAFILEDKI